MTGADSAERAADQVLAQLLQALTAQVPALRLDSPPGAGKTWAVERAAVEAGHQQRMRCMVVTQTNQQAFDLARRLTDHYPGHLLTLFLREGLPLPDDLATRNNLQTITEERCLPVEPGIVLANAAKWSWLRNPPAPWDVQIVDEAFQLPDHRFHQIANLALRYVLVGDPGQISPVIGCDIERWRHDPAGPHIPCPQALCARHRDILRLSLPVTRRLVADTVRFLQPSFYPDLPFTAVALPGERGISYTRSGGRSLDPPLDALANGASLVAALLPAQLTGEHDEALSATLVRLLVRLMERGARVLDHGRDRPLTPDLMGVICAHVSQVTAVRERLPDHLKGVLVETAERYQGLERALTLVHHPLAGRGQAKPFHLDAGRLCVMLSRHRVACILVGRHGMEERLLLHMPDDDRVLGQPADDAWEGWRAHLSLLRALRQTGRLHSI